MTISSTNRKAGPYAGNDVAVAFPFSFKVFSASDLYVIRTTPDGVENPLTLTTDYTVAMNTDQDANPGGTITLPAALASGYVLTITSNIQPLQSTDLTNQGGFYPKVITKALDKLTILVQQAFNSIGNSIKFPISDSNPITSLPGAAQRANKLLSFDSFGNPAVVAAASQSATQLTVDLSNASDMTKGAALIGGAGRVVGTIAALRTLPKTGSPYAFVLGYYAKGDGGGGAYYYDSTDTSSADNGGTIIVAADGGRWKLAYGKFVSLRQFGAKGDSTGATGTGQNDTAYIQAALTWATTTTMRKAEILAEEGIYRTTAALTAAAGFKLHGVHPRSRGLGGTDFGGGSWLYFDHTGKGISVTNSGGYFTDVTLEEIGTCRNQPAPASSWAPNAHDYDFYCFGVADIVLRNVLMLNPTKGAGMFGDPANGPGRLEIYNFKAQAFQVGIMIDTTYDVVRLDHLHFWPFWRDDSRVHTYTMGNLDAIYSLRNDNPMMSNLFTIFARSGLRVAQGANGGTSKIHLVNADFDRGVYGIWVDSSVTSGCTGQFENITHQGETGFAGSKGLFIQGNNSTLAFGSFDSGYAWQNAVRVEGSGNRVVFANAKANMYDQQVGNFPAFEAYSGNYIIFATRPVAINGGGAGGRFAATGNIICDEWRAFTPAVSSQTGTITTLGAVSGLYKLVGDTVTVEFDITITTNGTAAGDVRFNLPFGSPLQNFTGHGREMAVNGKSLSVVGQAGGTQALIYNYDNTYCGANNVRLVGTLQYRISI